MLTVALVAGALGALGLQPYGVWPLTLISLAALPWILADAPTWHRAALLGWFWATGYFLLAMTWIVEPFLVDVQRHGWMALFALVFMAGGLALFWAVAAGAAHAMGHSVLDRSVALIVTVGLAELARAYVLTGFPWAATAQAFVDTGAMQLLAWVGPHGLAIWIAAAAMLPSAVYQAQRLRALPVALIPAVALVAAAVAVTPPDAKLSESTVRVLQPNAPQHQKWDPNHVDTFFDRQVAFTGADQPPDLVVWPEAALPTVLDASGPAFDVISDAARGAAVAIGLQRRDGLRYFNSMVVLDKGGAPAGLYDKHHLVPFGEYMPLGWLAAYFGIYGLAAEDGVGFSAGPGPRTLTIPGLGSATALICYEAVFPQDVRGAPRGDFLLHVTNDAWFGERSGPYQHLAQARMRAVEQGLPLVRSANTGISGVIDPYGRLLAHLPLGVAGYRDSALPLPLPPTPYSESGDLPVFLFLAIMFIALLGRQLRSHTSF